MSVVDLAAARPKVRMARLLQVHLFNGVGGTRTLAHQAGTGTSVGSEARLVSLAVQAGRYPADAGMPAE